MTKQENGKYNNHHEVKRCVIKAVKEIDSTDTIFLMQLLVIINRHNDTKKKYQK